MSSNHALRTQPATRLIIHTTSQLSRCIVYETVTVEEPELW